MARRRKKQPPVPPEARRLLADYDAREGLSRERRTIRPPRLRREEIERAVSRATRNAAVGCSVGADLTVHLVVEAEGRAFTIARADRYEEKIRAALEAAARMVRDGTV